MSPQRFLAVVGASFVAALALVAALNWAVDPYAVFGTRVPGLRSDKAAAITQPFLAKTYLLERSQPATLLIGSSRVDIGIDPQSQAWARAPQPVFNYGVPGANLPTQAVLLRHALSATRPKLVVIGLALDECLVMPGALPGDRVASDPNIERLAVDASGAPNPTRWRARLEDKARALVSISALTDSLAALLDQRRESLSRVTALGFNNGADFDAAERAEGPNALFAAKDRSKIAGLLPWSMEQAFDLQPLAEMLTAAAAHGAEIAVFIHPNSGEDMMIYRRLGAEQTFDLWRERIVQIVAEAQRAGARAALWDFSGFTPYQTEAVPPPGRLTPQKWFWETNHYKPALGDLVVARMLGGGDETFGVRLDSANLQMVQDRFDAQGRQYGGDNPEATQRIDGILRAERQRRCAAKLACDASASQTAPDRRGQSLAPGALGPAFGRGWG